MKTIIVNDSRLPDQAVDSTQVTMEGPQSVTFQRITPPDPTSTNPNFVIQLPSLGTGLSRQLYWRMQGSFTVTGAALDALGVADRVALRQFALQSMTQSFSCQVNDSTTSIGPVSQIISSLLRVANPTSNGSGMQSATGSAPDTVSSYEGAVGRNNSPFAQANDHSSSNDIAGPRTVGITSIVLPAGGASMTVNFDVTEPIVIPPFTYTSGTDRAIYGVRQVQLSPIISNVSRGLSMALPAGTTVAGVTLAITSQEINAQFITPGPETMPRHLEDHTFRYDSVTVNVDQTTLTAGAIAAGASFTGSSNSFQLSTVPRRYIIAATYSETDRQDATQSLPDFFLPISAISISAGTRAGLLSGASQHSLWQLSNRNGAKTPYYQFNGSAMVSSGSVGGTAVNSAGSPLLIDVASDLALDPGQAPGQQGAYTFAVNSITVTNNSPNPLTGVRLIVIALTEGYIENKSGSTVKVIGGIPKLDHRDVKDAGRMSSEAYHLETDAAGFGGSWKGFLRGLKSVGKTVLPIAEMAASALAPEAAPGIAMVGKALGGKRLGRNSLYR